MRKRYIFQSALCSFCKALLTFKNYKLQTAKQLILKDFTFEFHSDHIYWYFASSFKLRPLASFSLKITKLILWCLKSIKNPKKLKKFPVNYTAINISIKFGRNCFRRREHYCGRFYAWICFRKLYDSAEPLVLLLLIRTGARPIQVSSLKILSYCMGFPIKN